MRFVALVAFVAFGQDARPDYNGTWALNSAKSVKAIQEGTSAAHGRLTIKVTELDVTLVHRIVSPDGELKSVSPGGWSERTTVCSFGPSPRENIRPMRPLLCSAKWDGDRLVITRTQKPSRVIAVETYSIAGTEMRIDVPAGNFPDGGPSPPVTLFYDKAKQRD